MKTILAAFIAGIFLCSTPAFAGDDKPADKDKKDKKEKKDDKKAETLKGTIVCTKCELGETKDCGNAIKTKIGDKEVIVYIDDKAKAEKYHKDFCTAPKKGSVTGVISEKDKKKISISMVRVARPTALPVDVSYVSSRYSSMEAEMRPSTSTSPRSRK